MYLRQIIDGAPRDPTMTYVRDLSAIKAGHWLQVTGSLCAVLALCDAGFDGVACLWADVERFPDGTVKAPGGVRIHDLRDEEPETWRYGMMTQDGRMPTADEARRWMARTRS